MLIYSDNIALRRTYDRGMSRPDHAPAGRSSRHRFLSYLNLRRERDKAGESRPVHPDFPDFRPPGTGGGTTAKANANGVLNGEQVGASHATESTTERARKGSSKRKRSFWRLVREFWGLGRGHRPIIVASICTLSLATVLFGVTPYSAKIIFDYILPGGGAGPQHLPAWLLSLAGVDADGHAGGAAAAFESLDADAASAVRTRLLVLIGAAILTLSVLAITIGMWGRWQMTRLTKRLQVTLRRRVFAHAARLPLHRVYELKTGGASSLLREDAGSAAELIFSLIYNPWRAVVQLLIAIGVLVSVDWRLVVLAVAILPAVWWSERLWIKRLRPVFRDIRFTRETIDSRITETFGGMRVVRAFGKERAEGTRFTTASHFMARQELLAWWWSRAIEIVWMILLPAATAAITIYGGWMVITGKLTTGDVVLFIAYTGLLLGPLETLTATATGIQTQLAAFDRTLDLLEEPVEFAEPDHNRAAAASALAMSGVLHADKGVKLVRARVGGNITLENLGFTYPKSDQPVLRGVNLEAPAGATVALVGTSGSGKTTLCNLVARFFDPTEGRILLDGVDLREINLESYRSLLGMVEQDVFLFDGTVAENIAYAAGASADHEDVIRAAKDANADEFIARLERGYNTIVGERGVRLSGGQKQRLAIARALLADPKILILDEATSSLDTESELAIQSSLDRLMVGRTTFVIAHRLSTIRHADIICVLEHGRIVEQGTHNELVALHGRYARMVRLQQDQQAITALAAGDDPAGDGLHNDGST